MENVLSTAEQRDEMWVGYYDRESVESAGSSLKMEPATGK
jgi:hypothetical protein